MAIKLLDDRLINKIAAGEVVERPASVVKELVENSLDAGSRKIQVRIMGGGIESIEVGDDGAGILEADLPLAFLRHATSKLYGEEDLFQIATMGFRGEALPSIASVSRLEIYTRSEPENGRCMILEGGRLLEEKSAPGPAGTKIIVRDLFFNTPARKNYLRTPVSEGNQVYELMCRYALARPDVSFEFANDRRTFFKTPGKGRLQDALMIIWSPEILSHMLPVSGEYGSYRLQGYVSSVHIHRQNRRNQLLFVNKRPVRSPLLYRALDLAYRGMLVVREQPLAVLHLGLPEGEVDVNVHPQKNEVRFRDEKRVFSTLMESLQQVLTREQGPADYQRPDLGGELEAAASIQPHISALPYQSGIPFIWRNQQVEEARPSFADQADQVVADDVEFSLIGQALESYIITEKQGSIWLIDQHAAHERIMYWRLKNALHERPGQILAVPLAVEFNQRQMEIIEAKGELIQRLGFRLDLLGPSSMLIREAPGLLAGREIEIIQELADLSDMADTDYEDAALIAMACKRAVKSGTALTRLEMASMVKELLTVPDYKFCPHGRPTIIRLTAYELDRMFKR